MTVRAEQDISLSRVDDGVSPTANVVKVGDTATITITDSGGTTTASISDGTSGPTITDIKTQYYLSTSDSSPTGGSWDDTPQEFESGLYYWTRDYTTYSDGTHSTSTPVYNQGLTLANEYAIDAKESANDAEDQATNAYNSAIQAIKQLSVVEDIVGVLDLVSKNGVYEPTGDLSPQEDKWYFVRNGSGTAEDPYWYTIAPPDYDYVLTSDVTIQSDKTYYTRSGSGTVIDPYVYTKVEEPDVSDIGTYYELESPMSLGYYELTDVTSSIQNYVSAHLVLTNQGVNLQNGKSRLLLSSEDGLILYDPTGTQIAQYGAETVIGSGGYQVTITPSAMSFINNNVSVASITSNELAIGNARINKSMRMGNYMWTVSADGRLILKYSSEQ